MSRILMIAILVGVVFSWHHTYQHQVMTSWIYGVYTLDARLMMVHMAHLAMLGLWLTAIAVWLERRG